jgi:hypothetical protein
MPVRPTDLTFRLNRLAELVPTSDKRRRVLENIDVIAQEAIDAQATYVNKKGDAVTADAPQWAVALKAQQLAAQLLGLDAQTGTEKPADGQPGQESAQIRAIREQADRPVRVVK